MLANTRIFPLYALVITALALYAWHLQAQKERQMAVYERQNQILLAVHDRLEKSTNHLLGRLRENSDAYPIPESETLYMQGKYVFKAAEALSQFSSKEISRSLDLVPDVQGWLPRVQRRILSDSAAAVFFQREKDFADSLRLFSRKYDTEFAAFKSFFSTERRAAAEHILDGNRPDQKAMFLVVARVRHTAAANHLLAFWNSCIADGVEYSRLPQIMPIPILEGTTCHRVGQTIRGEVEVCFDPINSKNVTYSVNGKPLPGITGPGKYNTAFRHAGLHQISLEAKLHNPLTGETKPFSKTTSIQVCD